MEIHAINKQEASMRAKGSCCVGEMLKSARSSRGWSQLQLQEQLGLARPISISKWERGEAPVPLHHWTALMRIFSIPREQFLAAARQDHHRQLASS